MLYLCWRTEWNLYVYIYVSYVWRARLRKLSFQNFFAFYQNLFFKVFFLIFLKVFTTFLKCQRKCHTYSGQTATNIRPYSGDTATHSHLYSFLWLEQKLGLFRLHSYSGSSRQTTPTAVTTRHHYGRTHSTFFHRRHVTTSSCQCHQGGRDQACEKIEATTCFSVACHTVPQAQERTRWSWCKTKKRSTSLLTIFSTTAADPSAKYTMSLFDTEEW